MKRPDKVPRAERVLAARLLLRQLRQANGRWTDGQKIFGPGEIAVMKRDLLHRIQGSPKIAFL